MLSLAAAVATVAAVAAVAAVATELLVLCSPRARNTVTTLAASPAAAAALSSRSMERAVEDKGSAEDVLAVDAAELAMLKNVYCLQICTINFISCSQLFWFCPYGCPALLVPLHWLVLGTVSCLLSPLSPADRLFLLLALHRADADESKPNHGAQHANVCEQAFAAHNMHTVM